MYSAAASRTTNGGCWMSAHLSLFKLAGGSLLATAGIAQAFRAWRVGQPVGGAVGKGGYLDFTKFTGLLRYVAFLPRLSAVLTGQGQFSSVPLINANWFPSAASASARL